MEYTGDTASGGPYSQNGLSISYGFTLTDPGHNHYVTAGNIDTSLSYTGVTLNLGHQAAFTYSGSQLAPFLSASEFGVPAGGRTMFDPGHEHSYSKGNTLLAGDGLSISPLSWTTITTFTYDRAPVGLAISSSSVAENQPIGTIVGTFSTTDPDAGDTFTYTLVSGAGSTGNASFTIDASGNLKTAASFNYEAQNSYAIRVRTTDQNGLWFEQQFTITITALTTVTFVAGSGVGTYGGSTNITAQLIADGQPVLNRTLNFLVNGVPFGSATTDATGTATVGVYSLVGLPAGTYPGYLSVNFAGDQTYLASSATSNLLVTPAPLLITADNQNRRYGTANPTLTAG